MPSQILVLALNPALDRTLWVPGFTPGKTNRVQRSRLDPGGKGINVARVLRALGASVQVMGFLGEENGDPIRTHLDQIGVPHRFLRVPGETRVNLKILTPETGTVTEVNDAGFVVPPEALERLTALVVEALSETGVLVLSGSLPRGVPADYYGQLIAKAREAGVRTVLDADSEPLALAVAAGPTVVKPNRDEATRLLGRPLTTRQEVLQAARDLRAQGPQTVVISCGAEGAVLVSPEGAWWAVPPAIQPRSTVGAGDAMVAALALALAEGWPPEEALRTATAAGAATASLEGTQPCSAREVASLRPLVGTQHLNLESVTGRTEG